MKVLVFIFFFVAFTILSRALFLTSYQDFNYYYLAGANLFSATVNPYQEPIIGFLYPPFALLFMFPLHLVPFFVAEKLWIIFSILSIFISVVLIFKANKQNIFSATGLIAIGLICFFFPVKFSLGMGQINCFILLIISLFYFFIVQKKIYKASFLLSLAISIKLFPLFIPFYFLILRKWKIFTSFIFFIGVLSFIAFIVVGSDLNFYYLQKVLPTLTGGWKLDYYNQSLTGFLGRNISDLNLRENVRLFLSLFFVITTILTILITKGKEKLLNFNFSLLIILNLIVNNFSWQHHFVFMIFPFLVNLFYFKDNKSKIGLLVLAIAYALVAYNFKYPLDYSPLITSSVFYGAIIMWVLQVMVIIRSSLPRKLHFPLDSLH